MSKPDIKISYMYMYMYMYMYLFHVIIISYHPMYIALTQPTDDYIA